MTSEQIFPSYSTGGLRSASDGTFDEQASRQNHPKVDRPLPAIFNILKSYYKHKVFHLAWILLLVTAAFVYLAVAKPIYTSAAAILLDPRPQNISGSERSSISVQDQLDNARADSQLQVIKSERLLRLVFDLLDLGRSSEFFSSQQEFSLRGKLAYFFPTIGASDTQSHNDTTDSAFRNFSSRVSARRIGQSYVVEITFAASDPKQASKFANAVAMAYVYQQIAIKFSIAKSAAEYLQNRLASFKEELELASAGVRLGKIPDAYFPDADARVISEAQVPIRPAAPNRFAILSLAFVFSIGTGLIFEMINNRY